MAKKVEEETMDNFTIDSSEVESFSKAQNVNTNSPQPPVQKGRVSVVSRERDTDNLINCLENKIVTV
jgi:hypothetical protein